MLFTSLFLANGLAFDHPTGPELELLTFVAHSVNTSTDVGNKCMSQRSLDHAVRRIGAV